MAKYFSKSVRVYFEAYDPGTALTRSGMTLAAPALDVTSITDAAERQIPDIRKDAVELVGWFDDGSDALDKALGTLLGNATARPLSYLISSTVGGVGYAGTAYFLGEQAPSELAGAVRLEGNFRPDQAWQRGAHFGERQLIASGATGSGTVDNSAATTNGGTAFYHVFSVTGIGTGTGRLQVEHSTDGTSWTGILELNGFTAGTAGVVAMAGTLNRYTRLTSQNGSLNCAAVLIRS